MNSSFPIASRGEIAGRVIHKARRLGISRLGVLLTALLVVAAPAHAGQAAERRAVLATVQGLFDALAARDQAALMALVIPEGRITSHSVRNGHVVVQAGGWLEWAARIAGVNDPLEERMYHPQIRVHGSL